LEIGPWKSKFFFKKLCNLKEVGVSFGKIGNVGNEGNSVRKWRKHFHHAPVTVGP
jgi:predicted transcriptional regulator